MELEVVNIYLKVVVEIIKEVSVHIVNDLLEVN